MVPVHESRILCDRLSPGARVAGKHLNMHSAPLQASPPSATTFLSPKVNQTQLDNSNRPTTTSTPSSNPRAPIHTTPITNATHASLHTQQGHIRPAPAPCRMLPRLPSRTQRERERENKQQRTANRQPPDPTRPDPADRRVSSSSPRAPKHCIAPPPPPPRFPRARHGTPPTLVRGLHRSGRDAPCRSRAFARVGGGGECHRRCYPTRKMEPTHTRPVFSACFPSSAVVVVVDVPVP